MADMTRNLPDNVITRIFRLLEFDDLSSAMLVCRKWRNLGEDPLLWAEFWLVVEEEQLPSISEMLTCRRLERVSLLELNTPVTEEVMPVIQYLGTKTRSSTNNRDLSLSSLTMRSVSNK